MAGTSYFNAGGRSGAGESPFYKLKPIPMTQKTNWEDGGLGFLGARQLYVLRPGVTNNVFAINSQNTCVLGSINSLGSHTGINTVTYTSILSGAVSTCFHLNSTDQCLYVLIRAASSFQLIKVSDASGLATALGSSFTPANLSRWPVGLQETGNSRYRATMEVDGSGHIRVYMEGYYHQINKTTGAIVSQDNVVNVGGYSLNTTSYYNSVTGLAAHGLQHNLTSQRDRTTLPRVVSSGSGVIADIVFPTSWLISSGAVYEAISYPILVDSDKVWLGDYIGSASTGPLGYVYRSDFDLFLQSIADWYTGV